MNQILVISLITGLVTAVFYAIQGIAEGLSARHTRYYEMAFITQFFALIFTIAAAIVTRQVISISLSAFGIAAVLGFIYALSLHFYFRALHIGPVSIVSPISGSYAIVAVPIAVLFLGEALTQWQYVGIALTAIGVFLVDFKMHHRKIKIVHRKYLTYAFATLFLWGIYMPIDSILIDQTNWFAALFWELIFVNLFLAVMLLKRESIGKFKKSVPLLVKAGLIIGLCEVLGGLVMNYGLAKGSVAIMTPLITVSTVFVVLYAVIFMRQKLQRQQAIGVACALIGIMILGGG